jgi:regulator of protease activity HflC (stomatin/prohibitin superfamily)
MNKRYGEVWGAIVIFGIIIVSVVCFLGFDQVEANHRGVVVEFGKPVGELTAGIQWTGIFASTKEYDMRIRRATVKMLGEQSAVDNTGQAVYGEISVNYRLKNENGVATGLWQNVGEDRIIAERLNIEPIIKEGYKQATVQFEAQEILQQRQKVKDLAKENIRNNFNQDYFEIVDIVVENIDFSPEYKKAIEDKKVATQNKLMEQEIIEVVKAQQQQEIEKYKADAEKLRLQKNEITPELLYKQWIERWDGHLPIYMLTSDNNANMLMQLPQAQMGE